MAKINRVSPIESISDAVKVKINLNDQFNNTTLAWSNVNVFVPPQKTGFFSCFKKTDETATKHILKNVDGIAKPGQVLAIMGASGAGKTTLLNALTFRNIGNLKITGDVTINGEKIVNAKQLAAISGYVQQDDIFIGTLKVKEHLKFQAMLRMDKSTTTEEKNKRVEEVLNDLNLKKCEDTLIGVAQLNIKGISGGEKRRLAFASEIITNPGILFCDEPTSGLDSFMAMSIVDSMKNLARQGKTIICTIHQPSSEIFEMFDRLLLMAEGRLAFIGDLPRAYEFFASQGFRCPMNYNPADYYIKTLAITPANKEKSKEVVESICDGFFNSNLSYDLKADIELSKKQTGTRSLSAITSEMDTYKTSSLNQTKWLVWRSLISTMRNPMDTRINVLQTIFIAIMFGLIFLRLENNQEGVQNINGVLFLLITNSSFSNMFPVLNSFPLEIPIFLREHHNGMYRVANYYFSKVLIEIPKYVIFPFIFTTIVYWMCNLNNSADRYIICCLTIILVANSSVSLGSFLSAASPSLNVALAISAPILVPLMIFSGYFLNNASIPDYFIWLKYLSWLGYSNEILVVNQWKGVQHIDCPENATRCFQNGDDVIEALKMNQDKYLLNFIWLGILIAGWRILALIALNIKASLKK